MKVLLLDEAVHDLAGGRSFYESLSGGLGDYFTDSLFADLRSLGLYAGIHMQVFGFHRMLARRFPFAIYYRVERRAARVYAVLDRRRDPLSTNARLGLEAGRQKR